MHKDLNVMVAGDRKHCSEATFNASKIMFFICEWKPSFVNIFSTLTELSRNSSFQIGKAYGGIFIFLLESISWSDGRVQPASQRSSWWKRPLVITNVSMKCLTLAKHCTSTKMLNQKYSGWLYVYSPFHYHYRKNIFCRATYILKLSLCQQWAFSSCWLALQPKSTRV